MGKTKTLGSSIKAMQEALSSFMATGPTCMQQPPRTGSFREHLDLLSNLDSTYYTAPSSNSSSSSIFLLPPASTATAQSSHLSQALTPDDELRTACEATCSSSSSANPDGAGAVAVPLGEISSKRFFFSPRTTTNSIMEETKAKKKTMTKHHVVRKPNVDGFFQKKRSAASISEESVPLVVSSLDPYRDFRVSMEEMVEANGLRDWSGLQELLDYYLHLNHEKTHNIILLAFVDLLMSLVCPEGPHSSSTSSSSSSTFSSSLLPTSSSSPFLQLSSSD